MVSSVAFAVAVVFVVYRIALDWRRRKALRQRQRSGFERTAREVLSECRKSPKDSLSVQTYEGTWRDQLVQIKFISDNLATRKLPVLWLAVSILERTTLPGRYDLMNRPAGLASFSNFHDLPYVLAKPDGTIDQCEARSDRADFPVERIRGEHLGFMAHPRAKELLASTNGVRLVWLLREADRARYGVFREADYGTIDIAAHEITDRLWDLWPLFRDLRVSDRSLADRVDATV